jgi:hypothetical protein
VTIEELKDEIDELSENDFSDLLDWMADQISEDEEES